MALHRTVTIKSSSSSDDNFRNPFSHAVLRDAITGEDLVSKGTISRRHDQRIKDDLTNKLYRVEMDRVKPGQDVQLQTANFRINAIRPRYRHYSPEPGARLHFRAPSHDRRRYSMAGNLEIYRPKASYSLERPEPGFSVGGADPATHWRACVHDGRRTDDLLSDYELRKQAELGVRGRSNGPVLVSSVSLVAPRARHSSTPPDAYYHTERVGTRTEAQPSRGQRIKVNDSQYELDQFEKLMSRTFGHGGVNRTKTLLYTAPPYGSYGHYGHYDYALPSAYYSTYPLATGAYYTPRPYYNGYYGGVYSPYYTGRGYYGGDYTGRPYYGGDYTGRPYYGGDYGNFYSSYVALPASGSNRYYYDEKPRYSSSASLPALYSHLYQKPLEYGLYSPPTRVTGPGHYTGYYDTDWYGETRAPYRYSTYTWRP